VESSSAIQRLSPRSTKLELGVDFTKGEYADEKADVQAVSLGVRYAF
jgi:hypothetical protein